MIKVIFPNKKVKISTLKDGHLIQLSKKSSVWYYLQSKVEGEAVITSALSGRTYRLPLDAYVFVK